MVFLFCRLLAAALAHGIINPDAVKWCIEVAYPAIGDGARAALDGRPIPAELADLPGKDVPLFMPGHDMESAKAAAPLLLAETIPDIIRAGVDLGAVADSHVGDVLAGADGLDSVVDRFAERRAKVAADRARAERDAAEDAAEDRDVPVPNADDDLEEGQPQPLVEALADFDCDPTGARIVLAAIAATQGLEPSMLGWDDLDHLDLATLAACNSADELHAEVDRLRRLAPVGA